MARIRYVGVIFLLAIGLAAGEILNKGWWRHTVFYQIYPRSFMDSDDDGVGDLIGIKSRLSHFKDAGIGAIWLSPINRSPMVDFGYDISDFLDVDEIFGTLQDFEELVAEAKKLGLKVILDLVPNHTSDQHYWFQQSVKGVGKYKGYYMWVKSNSTTKPPNNWISVFGKSAWTYSDTRKEWYLHQFEARQPDLNYSNPLVQEEMKHVIEFWLRKGVDGFRIDAVPHLFEANITQDEPRSNNKDATEDEYTYLNHTLTKDQPETYKLVQSWRDILDKYADENNEDEKVMMTEAYTDLVNTTKYYNYGSHIPFNFNFIINVNKTSKAIDFKNIIDNWMEHVPSDGVANWVMGNHDRSRTASRYPGRGDQMTMLAMILPGVAVTYYGEEIGMEDKRDISYADTQDPQGCIAGPDKYVDISRDPERTPFQWSNSVNAGFSKASKTWLPVHSNHATLNLEMQKTDKISHYKIYQQLISLRKESPALKSGSLETVVFNNTVLGIIRKDTKETVSLLINFSDSYRQRVDLSKYISGDTIERIITIGNSIKSGKIDIKSYVIQPRASVVLQTSGAQHIVSFAVVLISSVTFALFG